MNKSLLLLAGILLTQSAMGTGFEEDFISAAIKRTEHFVHYDGKYYKIPYPNGDVSPHLGVCSDVIIRTYRALGTDLQKLVHEDMIDHFTLYPSRRIWGLTSPDTNIDHRRVPNLQVFFSRYGDSLPISQFKRDYAPGDIVTWMLPGNRPHIGIVTNRVSLITGVPLIVHNIGAGPSLDDMLFDYEITGHYRYIPPKYRN